MMVFGRFHQGLLPFYGTFILVYFLFHNFFKAHAFIPFVALEEE